MQAGWNALPRWAALFGLMACAAGGHAQSAVDGAVGGRVVDRRGDAVAGAAVSVVSAALGVSRDAATGSDGEFLVVKLVPGQYDVTISAAGFETVAGKVTVELGGVASADRTLAISPLLMQLNVDAAPVPLAGQSE